MARIKTHEEIDIMTEGGKILARILRELCEYVSPGISTEELNALAISRAKQYGVETVLLGYKPDFAGRPYPAAICTSVNDVVQHGVPRPDEVLEAGDIIDIDMSIRYKGLVLDSGLTVPVDVIDAESKKLIDVTREARALGIQEARAGNHIGDISNAVERCVRKAGFSVVKELCGHGVGHEVHEDPYIPNFGKPGEGPKIEVGNVFAIEPIVNIGKGDIIGDEDGDGYSLFSADGSRSAHFEHTVAVTKDGPRILTL